MPSLTMPAIVLRYANYRDNDRMLTLLTPSRGRVEALSRGCRRPKSPLLGASELFCTGEYLMFVKGDKATITSCAIHDSFYPLRLDIDRLTCGIYLMNLCEAAAQPNEPCQELFHLLIRAISRLTYGESDWRTLACGFLLHYADLLGYKPRLNHCVKCGRRVGEEQELYFDHREGGVLCAGCRRPKAVALPWEQALWLRRALAGGPDGWMGLDAENAPFSLMRDYVETRLERPVKSGRMLG